MKILALIIATLVGALTAAMPAAAQVSVFVRIGPPAPRVEYIPAAPGPYYSWRAGYWDWDGARYFWIPGRYVRGPFEGSRFVPVVWERQGEGWVKHEGHWEHGDRGDRGHGHHGD